MIKKIKLLVWIFF